MHPNRTIKVYSLSLLMAIWCIKNRMFAKNYERMLVWIVFMFLVQRKKKQQNNNSSLCLHLPHQCSFIIFGILLLYITI